jgi:hypothetical protein
LLDDFEFTILITFKYTHDIVDFKSLASVVIELRHLTSKLSKLAIVEPLNTISVQERALVIHEEALLSYLAIV